MDSSRSNALVAIAVRTPPSARNNEIVPARHARGVRTGRLTITFVKPKLNV